MAEWIANDEFSFENIYRNYNEITREKMIERDEILKIILRHQKIWQKK